MKGMQDRARQAFTLIEVLLVVGIIGILAALVAASTVGHAEKARRNATWLQIGTLKTSISQFEMEVGRYPNDLQELVIEGDKNWPGPFIDAEELPKDGWGNDFAMEKKGKRIRVTSPGPDGQFNTEDDLWK